jgi:ligand-binding SRPBCC domain-containing protein
MKLYRLHAVQRLPISLEQAWAFFASPKNLPLITPPWLAFEMTNDAPARMQPGTILTYRIRPLFGVPVRWVTEITHAGEPYHFVDEQRFGPYRFWHHQHVFRPLEEGVEMEDVVHYGLPLGAAGRLAHGLVVRGRLQEIFAFRRAALLDRFGAYPVRPAGAAVSRGALDLPQAT